MNKIGKKKDETFLISVLVFFLSFVKINGVKQNIKLQKTFFSHLCRKKKKTNRLHEWEKTLVKNKRHR